MAPPLINRLLSASFSLLAPVAMPHARPPMQATPTLKAALRDHARLQRYGIGLTPKKQLRRLGVTLTEVQRYPGQYSDETTMVCVIRNKTQHEGDTHLFGADKMEVIR